MMDPAILPVSDEHGRRLIPHIIDDVAQIDAEREVFLSPRSNDPKDGWDVITYGGFANAINRCAHEIISTHGEPHEREYPTLAYIGPQDARYLILLVAAVKAGYKTLFISPRNSHKAQINLFEVTNCQILWFPQSLTSTCAPWLLERKLKTHIVPPLAEWFPTEKVPHFPWNKTFEQVEWEPLCVMHTSGSTGLPKPVIVKHGMLALSDAYHKPVKAAFKGSNYWQVELKSKVQRHFTPMPLFHAAALYSFFTNSIYWGITTVLGFGDKPLTADLVLECVSELDIQGALLPPSVLEDISQTRESMDVLASKLKLVIFGGGHLARDAGERLIQNGVPVMNMIAATELGSWPMYCVNERDAWQYFKFDSEAFGAEWRPKGLDDAYELVIVRKDKHPGFQGFFYTFPDLKEYSTKDIYKKHPVYPDLWLYYGRADNIIVFSNGEKLNPISIEETVQDHPNVKGAIVIGANRFQAGLVIEPIEPLKSADQERKLIDSVWPYVEKANRDTVAHGHITRELIAIASPGKPFLRAGKGTIQVSSTTQLYAEEINHLYERAEKGTELEVAVADTTSKASLATLVLNVFESIGHGVRLEPDTDFFSAGFDSLQVMNASRSLRAGLSKAVPDLDPTLLHTRFIYKNPTPQRLSQYIYSIINETVADNESEDAADINTAKQLYSKYTANLTIGEAGRPNAPNTEQTVLLTGSTGMLGSYLLDQLIRNPAISRVICLNRAEDGGARQQQKQIEERGLTQYPKFTKKIEYLHVDVSKHKLGLSDDRYAQLLKEAHRIIHNAWPVNFNISTDSFEPSIHGVRRLADFAAEAYHRVAVVFISSIGTVTRWDTSKGPVPETRLEDWSLPGGSYGRSKMVGGLILEDAAEAGDFSAAVIRVGQIAGSETGKGVWNRHEWLPSLIASSLYLGALPRDLGFHNRVDWTPVERVARLVLDIVGAGPARDTEAKHISGYYHAVNSSVTEWGTLAPSIQQFYGGQIKELISFKEWVSRLESSNVRDVDTNPGFKLIDTYREMAAGGEPVELALERTNQRSTTMMDAPVISPELMGTWLRQWNFGESEDRDLGDNEPTETGNASSGATSHEFPEKRVLDDETKRTSKWKNLTKKLKMMSTFRKRSAPQAVS